MQPMPLAQGSKKFVVRFVAPAFLGDSEQAGRWRTPPFKALLRQFWRMAYARDHRYAPHLDSMRAAEGALFGQASDHERGSTRSLLRLRLSSWAPGRMASIASLGPVATGESRVKCESSSYLGYGPVAQRGGLSHKPAIDAQEASHLSLGFDPRPSGRDTIRDEHDRIDDALALATLYGAVGGRSRNGWGSIELDLLPDLANLSIPQRPWRDALQLDWAHALGVDDKGLLVWQTEDCDGWGKAMRMLAGVRYQVRHLFPMGTATRQGPEDRHWLAYPMTGSSFAGWSDRHTSGRLPNSLRFRLRSVPGKPDLVVGVVFHVPCSPPPEFKPNRAAIEGVWEKVHRFLDTQTGFGLKREER